VTRVLALDVGSSSLRAAVYDEQAAVVSQLHRRRYAVSPDGVLEPRGLLEDALSAASQARSDGAVDAAGASSFWHSLLALDEHGRPLTPLLTWRDVRSTPYAARLRERLDKDAVWARTGCPLHASFWPAKLAWLAAEHPSEFRRARRFVGFADWLFEKQTGELRTSLSMASGTGLLSGGGWDAELLAELGLDQDRLPVVGDEPVDGWHPALGDGACSNLGSGCTTRDRAALNIGTSAALRVVTRDDEPPPPGLFRYRVDRERSLVGGSLTVGAALLQWLRQALRVEGGRRLSGRPPAGHGLTFVPHLSGERSPGWNDAAAGIVDGLHFDTTALDILQAGVEGLALELRRVADLMPWIREVVVSGGVARDRDTLQIVADVLERPLLVSEVSEASARGAAVAVLERLGYAPTAPPAGSMVAPRAERAPAYREAFRRHVRLLGARR
jgi:gluconokinase